MNELEFTLVLNSEDLPKKTEYNLFTEADERLKSLAANHTDMTGAAINLRRPASGETSFLHEVTVVIYGRPHHIAATEKDASPEQALKGALDAAERQIRERRKKLKQPWKQPGNLPVEQEIGEVYLAESQTSDDNLEDDQIEEL
jgi:ribosome-associated translation inhibitor RaiA